MAALPQQHQRHIQEQHVRRRATTAAAAATSKAATTTATTTALHGHGINTWQHQVSLHNAQDVKVGSTDDFTINLITVN